MNYGRHYDRLIERARSRALAGYVERHHIIPRCMGGTDDQTNIARLTAEEHFVAHQLLVKMNPGHIGLIWALSNMTGNTGRMQRSNKRYGWLRRKFAQMLSETNKGRQFTPEHRARLSASHLGKTNAPHSDATKAKMSAAAKGRKKSATHRAALSAAKMGKLRGPQTEQHIARRVASVRLSRAARAMEV